MMNDDTTSGRGSRRDGEASRKSDRNVYRLDEFQRSVLHSQLDTLEDLLYEFCDLMERTGEETIMDRTTIIRNAVRDRAVAYRELADLERALAPFKAWCDGMESTVRDMYSTLAR